jgi:hypothetical protein
LTNIKNGGSNLTSGTHYSVSGSTVTIKKEYLATQSLGTTTLVFTFSAGSTQNLVITVADTSNSSISPANAVFDKRSDLQADITVTMTLNGNTLTNIKNGGSNLTSGTHYSVSGSTVTINKSYLSGLSVGTTTLVFTFSAGAVQNLTITVKESAPGGGTGTKYDFATDTFSDGYPKFTGTGTMTAEIVGGVLRVAKTNNNNSTMKFILPFNLGSQTLANYSKIKIWMRGVSGDIGFKDFRSEVGTNTVLTTQQVNLGKPDTSAKEYIFNFSSGTWNSYTGEIEIGFLLNNTQEYVIEITSIELIP